MEAVFRISALAVVASLCSCMLRGSIGSVSVVLSIAVCVSVLIIAIHFLEPVIELLLRMQEMTGMSETLLAPLIKVLGIGLLTQISGTICDDAGEKTLQQSVEIAGMILSFYTSLPLLTSTLDLLEEILSQ